MNKNSLVSMRDLSKDDMIHILNDALMFSNSQSDWQLPDKALIANLFLKHPQEHIIPLNLLNCS